MAKVIKLYGNISEYSSSNAQEIVWQIDRLQGGEPIELHVHSYGGSVIEGNIIFNAIRKSKTPVDAYIDGIAASMAAIIVQACRKVYMAENAFIMIHCPGAQTTSGRGLAADHLETAKILDAMTSNFRRSLAKQTGRTEEETKKWLDGIDHWFNAESALAEGLIDGITDQIAPSTVPDTSALASSKIEDIYGMYTALTSTSPIPDNPKTKDMDKQELINCFGLQGVTAQSSDADVTAALKKRFAEKDAAVQTATAQIEASCKANIAALLDPLKLKPEQRMQFEAIGMKLGIEALQTAIAPLQAQGKQPTLSELIAGRASSPGAAVGKTWDELDRAGGLETLKAKDPDQFRALFVERFGHEPANY